MSDRLVRDEAGNRYILEKESGSSSRVRDPETGERMHLPTETLEPVADTTPFDGAGETLDPASVSISDGITDRRSLGLLAHLDEHGPQSVRALLGESTLCESDLHGRLTELTAAGLLTEVTIHGERGYELTEVARDALDS